MNVVVVGGGIVGLASAYSLARAGASVTLYERGALGTESTARSAGGIRSQFSTAVNVELSVASREVWDSFEEEFGVDMGYRRHGYLFLARSEETAQQFRANVAMQNDLGVESEFITPEEATDHCPELHTERFVGGTFNAEDGYADPNLAVQGFAAATREAGAAIHTKTGVTGLLTETRDGQQTVTGVQTESGAHEAEFVVNAAGAWSRRVAAMAGVDLPIYPRRRQIAVVDPSVHLPEDVPLTIDLETGSYFRPEREGTALVGGHFDTDDPTVDAERYSESMDIEWAATAVEHAADCAGYFDGDSRIKRGWAGLYAVTPDHHPVIEETIPGLVTAAGFSGHGFQHSPATGRLVAELCLDGEASLVDIDVLASDRFDTDESGLFEENVA